MNHSLESDQAAVGQALSDRENHAGRSAGGSLTKIVATVGPASSDAATLAKLIEAGASIFRLNFGHGTLNDHLSRLKQIRRLAGEMGRPVAVLGDLQGPKLRVGAIADAQVDVAPGDILRFERGSFAGGRANSVVRLSCTFANLVDDVLPGQRILIADGAIRTLVVDVQQDHLEARVMPGGGGTISSGKGINLPDSQLRMPSTSQRDLECVQWAIRNELDFLALSFVRSADDVLALAAMVRQQQAAVGSNDSPPSIIAKIETPAAVDAIEAIVDASDGIMVARGDLGVEMDLASVPVIQRQLVTVAKEFGKPCIVATQMLESMIDSAVPTRAEASDVATAILEETDAVMLSGETAMGKYPVLAVEYMRRIAERTEAYIASLPQSPSPPRRLVESRYRTAALAHGVWSVATDLGARFVVAWSQKGGGARYLSQNNFCIPIIACTNDDRAARRMQILRGVTPVRMNVPESPAHFTRMVDAYLLETGWAHEGDVCILVAGSRLGVQGVTNSLAIHRIGDPTTGYS